MATNDTIPASLMRSYDRLLDLLKSMEHVAVAFSGGIDSSLLLKAASEALPGKVMAITVDSPFHPEKEIANTRRLAALLGVEHVVLTLDLLADIHIAQNPPDRCYRCKQLIFRSILKYLSDGPPRVLLDGSTADDRPEERPGMKALEELAIRSPLRETGLTKRQIRRLARWKDLPNWRQPAGACLATRIPAGETIDTERLRRIERAEDFLMQFDLKHLRVRDHHTIARIETDAAGMRKLVSARIRITTQLESLGYRFVTIDLKGYPKRRN